MMQGRSELHRDGLPLVVAVVVVVVGGRGGRLLCVRVCVGVCGWVGGEI